MKIIALVVVVLACVVLVTVWLKLFREQAEASGQPPVGLSDVVRTVFNEPPRPALPITVSFRRALFCQGLVAQFRNATSRYVELVATFASPATRQNVRYRLVVRPGSIQEFGCQEGWDFVPGQRIRLENANFRPVEMVVPGR